MGWISVEDRLPSIEYDFAPILIFTGFGFHKVVLGNYVRLGITDCTHWMPIPDMPKED